MIFSQNKTMRNIFGLFFLFMLLQACSEKIEPLITVQKGDRIVLIGNNLGSRMMGFGYFETELQTNYPDSMLLVRNISSPGNTSGFRPHPSRKSPWAFPGAEKFNSEYDINTGSTGHFPTEDEWLSNLEADIILSFFGYNESFRGEAGLSVYEDELNAFIDHTLKQNYNKHSTPQLVMVSPIAFEDLSNKYDLPNGVEINKNLKVYTEVMKKVCKAKNVKFLDVYTPSAKWYKSSNKDLTIDGSQMNDEGYKKLSKHLVSHIFGKGKNSSKKHEKAVRQAVLEKNWMWNNDFKIPNGVHAYGRRYNPYGPDNYPFEIEKIREMTHNRDQVIWAAVKGIVLDLNEMDSKTSVLPEVETNYNIESFGIPEYKYGKDALNTFELPEGYKIELFASEVEFPDLANPVRINFDARGRLWVAVMPSYPHWKPGDGKPDDKILIFEDTNNDGKADKQIVFADSLHLPIGFEFAPEGVYLSQGRNLVLLKDVDGDDKADVKKVILSGFDDHDTHHAHSAYTMDPSGAIYMAEGVFLHSNIETSYGPIRGTNGGFFRYSPQNKKLERIAQMSIPNPWGIAVDDWGQIIYAETSGPDVRWMLPSTIKPRYGEATDKLWSLVDPDHRVRPTSGLEFVSSRHFPDEVQGDYLINNTIGFLGTKQHTFVDSETGYESSFRQDLVRSDDKNYRPVDLQFAPDGSLYIVDWHNALIGHMQHNARDPLRDHVHGRIYRITYPSRPLVVPAKIYKASINELLENLKLPEYRTRYRTRNELRTKPAKEVLMQTKKWITSLDESDENYEHNLLEALWVTWGVNKIDKELLEKLISAEDYRVRAAAVQALRFNIDKIDNYKKLLAKAAKDPHGRVRLEVIVAVSWLDSTTGLEILDLVDRNTLDKWMIPAFQTSYAHLNNESVKDHKEKNPISNLRGEEKEQYKRGQLIYAMDGFCSTCHQSDGKGLPTSGFPPLSGSWVTGNKDRLISLTLKGLHGPISVDGKDYPGQVPMTAFEGLLSNEEVADVLTFVRNSFGNKGSAVSPMEVDKIRKSIEGKKGFYTPEELLNMYPLEK